MITETLLLFSSVIIFTGFFSSLCVWGTKILYTEQLKEIYKNKNELVEIINLRLRDLELEGKEDYEEHKTLTILLNDLIKIK